MNFRHLTKGYRLGARFPRAGLAFALLLTLLALWAARDLKIQDDLISLLPKTMESVRSLRRFQESFGGLGHLAVVVEAETPGQAERFAGLLIRQIEKHPGVDYVDYRRPVEYFEKRQWLYLDLEDLEEMERRIDRALELEKKGVSPLFSRLMGFADEEDRADLEFKDIRERYRKRWGGTKEVVSSEDGRLIVLRVRPKESLQKWDRTRNLVEDLRKIDRDLRGQEEFQTVTVGYTGSYQKMVEQSAQIRREIIRISIVVSLILFLKWLNITKRGEKY